MLVCSWYMQEGSNAARALRGKIFIYLEEVVIAIDRISHAPKRRHSLN